MKVVVAEKISSSAIDLLREPRWTIVTPDQVEGKLAAQSANGRCADRSLGGAG